MKYTASLFVCLFLFASPVASAAELRVDEEVAITTAVDDDLYVAGGTVGIEERIFGDLVSAGGEITVIGNIAEDILAAGGRIDVYGDIGEDLRIIAGDITIQGDVGEDVIVVAGSVRISPDAVIRGDVLVAGGDISILGDVRGSVKARGGRVVIEGTIGGDFDVRADDVRIGGTIKGESIIGAMTITLMEDAALQQSVTYWTPDGEMNFDPALKGGQAKYDESLGRMIDTAKGYTGSMVAAGFALSFLMSVLTGVMLIALMVFISKTFFHDTTKLVRKKMWTCFFTGLIYFIITPIIAVIISFTVIGIPIALMMMAMYFFSLYLAKALTAVVAIRVIENRYKKKWNNWMIVGAAVGIFILLKFLAYIPLLGWLATLFAVCTAYGAVLRVKFVRCKKIL